MSDAVQKTDGAQNLGATQGAVELNLLTSKIRQKQEAQKQAAALLSELEEFASDLLEGQESEGKAQTNTAINTGPGKQAGQEAEEAPSGEASSGTPTSQQRFGGSDFYISNNIPFSMFVDMMEERLKQLNAQSENQQMISLAYAGKDKSVDADGKTTFSDQEGGGIVSMLCDTIISGAQADSMKTMLGASEQMASAAGSLAAAFTLAHGSTDKEQGEVDRLSQAMDAGKGIEAGGSLTLGQTSATRPNSGGKDADALEDAISGLQNGDDAIYDDLQLGSTKVVKGKKTSFNKANPTDPDYIAQAEGTQTPNARKHIVGETQADASKKITAEEALANATPTERRAIRAKMQKKLDVAKEALAAKEKRNDATRTTLQSTVQAIGKTVGGGVQMQQTAIDMEKGRQQALQQSDTAIQSTLGKIGDGAKTANDSDKQRIDQAKQDLDKIIQIIGQRG